MLLWGIVVPLVAFAVLFVSRGLILRRLRGHHPERWDILGRPDPWFPRANWQGQLPYASYLKKGRHEELSDQKLIRLVWVSDVSRWVFLGSLLGVSFFALYRVWSGA